MSDEGEEVSSELLRRWLAVPEGPPESLWQTALAAAVEADDDVGAAEHEVLAPVAAGEEEWLDAHDPFDFDEDGLGSGHDDGRADHVAQVDDVDVAAGTEVTDDGDWS